MIDNAEELKEKALANKDDLKRKSVNLPIGDGEYDFRITGIGGKAVKLEKYVKYDEIMEAISEGHDEGLEAIIKTLIEEFDNENEIEDAE